MTVKANVAGGGMIRADGTINPILTERGPEGPGGHNGWSAVFGGEADGTRTLVRVVDWIGGQGPKPAIGMYIGPAGYVAAKADAFNFNASKRVMILSGATNAQGVAMIPFNVTFAVPPAVRALPATTAILSGATRSTVGMVSTTQCVVTVQQQAALTGIVSLLAGATANVIVIEA